MRKIIALTLALVMCLALVACGSGNTPTVDNDGNGVTFNKLHWTHSDVYYNDDGTFDAITTEEGITLTSDNDNRFLISFEDESWSYIVSPYDQINLKVKGGKIISLVYYGYDGIPLGGHFDEASCTLAFGEPTDEVNVPAADKNGETIVEIVMTISNTDGKLFVASLDRADIGA